MPFTLSTLRCRVCVLLLTCARVCGACVRTRANVVRVRADGSSSVCFSANDPNLISVQDSEATKATDILKGPTVTQKAIGKGEEKGRKINIFEVSEKQMRAQDRI